PARFLGRERRGTRPGAPGARFLGPGGGRREVGPAGRVGDGRPRRLKELPATGKGTVMPVMTAPARETAEARASWLQGRDVVCFSHDWSGDPLSKTHLMRLLARTNRVLWVNSIGYRAPTASRADLGRAFRKLLAAARPMRQV